MRRAGWMILAGMVSALLWLVLIAGIVAIFAPRLAWADGGEPPAGFVTGVPIVPTAKPAAAPVVVRAFTEFPVGSADPLAAAMLTEPCVFHGEPWARPLEEQAADAAARLAAVPPGYRGACFGGWFFRPLVDAETARMFQLDAPAPVLDARQGSYCNLSWETARLRIIAAALARAGVQLDWAYFDFEHTWSYWSFAAAGDFATIEAIAGDRAMALRAPALAAARAAPHVQDAIKTDPGFRPFVDAFDAMALRVAKVSMVKALADSGLASRVGGGRGPIVNFGFSRRGGFALLDKWGWDQPAGGQDATIDASGSTSYVAYLAPPNARGTKDALWNALIDDVNHVRSLLAVGPCCPVVQTCAWTPDRAITTEILLAHAVRSGAIVLDVFNPPGCQGAPETELAAMLARQYRAASAMRLTLPEIPLDAEEIRTPTPGGAYVTTYAEWFSAVDAVRPHAAPESPGGTVSP